MKFIRPGKHLRDKEVVVRNILLLTQDLTEQRDLVHKALILDDAPLIQASIQQWQKQVNQQLQHVDMLYQEIPHQLYESYRSYLDTQTNILQTHIQPNGTLDITHQQLLKMLHAELNSLREKMRS